MNSKLYFIFDLLFHVFQQLSVDVMLTKFLILAWSGYE
jgi:hypothetical protein